MGGEALSAENPAYLEHAKVVRRKTRARGNGSGVPPSNPTVPPEKSSTGLKPLSEMSATDRYQREAEGQFAIAKEPSLARVGPTHRRALWTRATKAPRVRGPLRIAQPDRQKPRLARNRLNGFPGR